MIGGRGEPGQRVYPGLRLLQIVKVREAVPVTPRRAIQRAEPA